MSEKQEVKTTEKLYSLEHGKTYAVQLERYVDKNQLTSIADELAAQTKKTGIKFIVFTKDASVQSIAS
ncbi:MAG: hypothetical protein OQK29_01400 [Ignavibacteriaceae bacterium]|nr:hypothetical protein [Ignavibacteriaceae bacterium]